MTVILGVDPGLNVTGFGLLQATRARVRFLEAGTINGGGAARPLGARLGDLFDALDQLLVQWNPSAMAIEKIYSHYAHPQTAVLMAHARGVLCLAASRRQVPTFDYAATEVKSSLTGNGRAPKLQVQRTVQQALELNRLPQPDDVADALALALCHYRRAGID